MIKVVFTLTGESYDPDDNVEEAEKFCAGLKQILVEDAAKNMVNVKVEYHVTKEPTVS